MAQIAAEMWEQTLRETPDPFRDPRLLEELGIIPRKTYRERLDEQPRNCFGELIPRIVTVRHNLWRLKVGW